jgi:hypothetical protein
MITLLAKYETQKYVFIIVTSLLIVSTRIDGGDKYGSKDTFTIEKCSREREFVVNKYYR